MRIIDGSLQEVLYVNNEISVMGFSKVNRGISIIMDKVYKLSSDWFKSLITLTSMLGFMLHKLAHYLTH